MVCSDEEEGVPPLRQLVGFGKLALTTMLLEPSRHTWGSKQTPTGVRNARSGKQNSSASGAR